jgi:hypothetical protein
VDLLKNWEQAREVCQQNNVVIKHYPIYFPSNPAVQRANSQSSRLSIFFSDKGEYQPPLSWKLTRKEKLAIKDAWMAMLHEEEGVLSRIKKLWFEEWNMG